MLVSANKHFSPIVYRKLERNINRPPYQPYIYFLFIMLILRTELSVDFNFLGAPVRTPRGEREVFQIKLIGLYSSANDPGTANDPRPQMIPQIGPQMIPLKI